MVFFVSLYKTLEKMVYALENGDREGIKKLSHDYQKEREKIVGRSPELLDFPDGDDALKTYDECIGLCLHPTGEDSASRAIDLFDNIRTEYSRYLLSAMSRRRKRRDTVLGLHRHSMRHHRN